MSGNASFDRDPKGFFRNLSDRVGRLERRIPGQATDSTGGFVPPVVNTHTPIILNGTPSNTTDDSWWGSDVHVDFITFTAEATGTLTSDVLRVARQYPYAIYGPTLMPALFDPEPVVEAYGAQWEYYAGMGGLTVYIYKGDTVDQDYPGRGDSGADNDSEYVSFGMTFVEGSDTFTVTAGETLTAVLIWWDSWRHEDAGEKPTADVGGLVYAINAALAGVDLNGTTWRSLTYPGQYTPAFDVTDTGYIKENPAGQTDDLTAEASGNGTFAYGEGSRAHGVGTQAIRGSHAEGVGSIASDNSHAEGRYARALALGSHAEGESTVAGVWVPFAFLGRGSHAEGNQTVTGGDYSHAEGTESKVDSGATGSHAEGGGTRAMLAYSHVEGIRTVSHRYQEHARGTGWGSDHLLSASRVSGPGYPTDTSGSGYMMTPRFAIGQQEIALTTGRLTRMEILVLGVAANETLGACWRILGLAYKPSTGNARVIGTPTVTKEFGDAGTSGWSVSIAVTTAGQVRVTTNASGTLARWSGLYHFTEVPYNDLYL